MFFYKFFLSRLLYLFIVPIVDKYEGILQLIFKPIFEIPTLWVG